MAKNDPETWPVSNTGTPQTASEGPLICITNFLRNEQLPVSMDLTVHKDVSEARTSVPTHAMQRVGLCPGTNVHTSTKEQLLFFVIQVSAKGKSHLR